ncbi:MAG: hypothetical protein ACK55I_33290, partial [bacterium]
MDVNISSALGTAVLAWSVDRLPPLVVEDKTVLVVVEAALTSTDGRFTTLSLGRAVDVNISSALGTAVLAWSVD